MANLLINGNFQDGATQWNPLDSAFPPKVVPDGERMAAFIYSHAFSGLKQTLTTPAQASKFTVRFDVRNAVPGVTTSIAGLSLQFTGPDGAPAVSPFYVATSANWQSVSGTTDVVSDLKLISVLLTTIYAPDGKELKRVTEEQIKAQSVLITNIVIEPVK